MNKSLWIILILLSLFLVLFSFHKINLPTSDIGRHIANGNILLNNAQYDISKKDILYTNLFSYTHPDFPFINHHWGSGIIIYLIFSILGFNGLSIFYFLLVLGALIFTLVVMSDEADKSILFFTSVFLIPLIAGRTEIRPEGLSYFFLAVFLYLLYRYSKDKISYRMIWLIPFLELIWANMHIYFIFGPFLIGIFLIEALFLKNKEKVKKLGIILLSSFIAMCITPYGIKGALYPFTIFQNYGYRIVENQSINFLEHLSFINPEFFWYKIILLLIITTSIVIIIKQRKSFLLALSVIALVFAVLGYFGIRHIPAFALLSLPLLVYNLTVIKKILENKINYKTDVDVKVIFYAVFSLILITVTMFQFSTKLPWNRDFGIGINKKQLAPIEFIKNNKIHGPFFNNYDIGGLMIFGFFPKERVFVDNRPEAYPKEFFKNIYVPMQEREDIWEQELKKNKFNAIFFYRLDYTPWSQTFLISRVSDPLWAPIYVDDQTIIFLYRNEENKEIIKKYELPKEMFKIK